MVTNQTGNEYARLNEVILSLRMNSVLQRTAEALLRLQVKFARDPEGVISFYVTKEQLAKIIGSSVESVSRTLAWLKQTNYLDFEKNKQYGQGTRSNCRQSLASRLSR